MGHTIVNIWAVSQSGHQEQLDIQKRQREMRKEQKRERPYQPVRKGVTISWRMIHWQIAFEELRVTTTTQIIFVVSIYCMYFLWILLILTTKDCAI